MPNERTPQATGGCQCGAIRYALYVAPENTHVCHCRMCQRATGGLFAALTGAPKSAFEWTRGSPSFFASSNRATRGFCAACGTPLSFAYELPEARMYVTIGSLDHPEALSLVKQYGIESRIPWVEFCQSVPSEVTGIAPAATNYLATMISRQS
jgi:hypothetical protein